MPVKRLALVVLLAALPLIACSDDKQTAAAPTTTTTTLGPRNDALARGACAEVQLSNTRFNDTEMASALTFLRGSNIAELVAAADKIAAAPTLAAQIDILYTDVKPWCEQNGFNR